MSAWTATDIRTWRARLGWTQARAADALCFHLMAYKKLECSTRPIVLRTRRMCELLEMQHVRSLRIASVDGGARQVFSTPEAVLQRLDDLGSKGQLMAGDGRRKLRYVTLFSGIEAASASFERLGYDAVAVAFSEVDPAANAVLRYRWPDVPRVGSVVDFDWSRLRGKVDCILAGPPCQSFSMAGRRLGLSDPRGNLTLHALRAIDAVQPRFFVIENVPGFLTADNGEALAVFEKAVTELGYALAWRTLNAEHFGTPQRRRRVWFVGERDRDRRGPVEVLDLQESEGRPEIARGTNWKTPARRLEGRTGRLNGATGGPVDWSDLRAWYSLAETRLAVERKTEEDPEQAPPPRRVLAVNFRNSTVDAVSPCLQTKSNSLNSNPSLIIEEDGRTELRRLTTTECLRLQGFDDDWVEGPLLNGKPLTEPDRYRLIGNSWPVPVAAWILSGLVMMFDGTVTYAVPFTWRRRKPFVAATASGPVPACANDNGHAVPLPGVGRARASGGIADMISEAVRSLRLAG